MNIPDKAIEAAAKVMAAKNPSLPNKWEDVPGRWQQAYVESVRETLEAAAPFIAAQALRDYADVVADGRVSFRDSEARGLRERAKWLEAGA